LPTISWLLIKAMLWVESSGSDNPAWKKQAMQIGNPGDPEFDALRQKREDSDLIMSNKLQQAIKRAELMSPRSIFRLEPYISTREWLTHK